MKYKYGFAIYRDSQFGRNGYAHLTFRFVWLNPGLGKEELFEIQWQADNHSIEGRWYGGGIQIKLGSLELLTVANRLAQRLFKDIGFYHLTPERALEAINAKRDVKRVIYDGRASEYLEPQDILPAEWGTWKDNNNNVHAIAFDEDHAKDEIDKELRASIDKGYVSRKQYAQWVIQYRPVAFLSNARGPEILTDAQAIRVIGSELDEEE